MDRKPPVSENQELEVEVQSVGQKGDGIARYNGFILVVPGTQRGDFVKVRVTKVLPKLGFTTVIQKLDKSARSPRERRFSQQPRGPQKDEFDIAAEKYDESQDSEEF